MATAPRFQIVTEFSAFEGWRNCLAVDRRESPMRPVVLSFVPARVADAPERLAQLAEDVERAARLFHPNILRVIGMETFGEAPVVVQEWRDGESLRELLDTGARVPPEVAARIVADACDAVQHAHSRAADQGRPFAHGALRAERVLVGADGAVLVSGFGRAAEGDGSSPTTAEDVRALGALLLQCLGGEQPAGAGLPGVPEKLATVAARAAGPTPAFPSAEALRKALVDAVPLATTERVKGWADGVLPADAGTRGRRHR
ncbi:MAG TPA: protein kinase, partial [Anaeromyxobacteraceae bacterium]|nr:protein kinase [Anaeromyxobacteraceae bacterium]